LTVGDEYRHYTNIKYFLSIGGSVLRTDRLYRDRDLTPPELADRHR
jgi:hypothetical protein